MGSESNNNSRIKKGAKKKGKLVFAKDKNQAVIAIVIMCLFFGNSLYMAVKYFIDQNTQNSAAMKDSSSIPAENMLSQQQKDLESLTGETSTGTGDNSQNQNVAQDANDIYSQTMDLQKNPPNQSLNVVGGPEEEVDIIPRKANKNMKKVVITITDSGRINPFLPIDENFHSASLPFLTPPPENLPTNSDASKVMSTQISGILYDKYSPSAIINIEGSDYLVKKGDIINNYRVLGISKTQVIVQLGKNIYQAGVGELLSQTNINYNTIANLNKKFGGNDVSIHVRKKGY